MVQPNPKTQINSQITGGNRYPPDITYSYSRLAAAVLNLALQDSQDYRKPKNKQAQHKADINRADAKDFWEKEESKEWRELLIGLAAFWAEKTSPSGFIEPVSLRKKPSNLTLDIIL